MNTRALKKELGPSLSLGGMHSSCVCLAMRHTVCARERERERERSRALVCVRANDEEQEPGVILYSDRKRRGVGLSEKKSIE